MPQRNVSEIASSGTTHLLQSPVVDEPLKRGERWFVPEKLGSVARLVDGTGTTTQTYSYKPFSETTANPSPGDSNPFQFTGRESECSTGLMSCRRPEPLRRTSVPRFDDHRQPW